jgi:cell wall-associated NlpC family hydrolase
MMRRLIFVVGTLLLSGCAVVPRQEIPMANDEPGRAALEAVKAKFAPDSHMAIFNVTLLHRRSEVILKGEVDNPEAKKEALAALAGVGVNAVDEITVLPSPELGAKTWGIATVSLLNAREKPGNAAEMGTQVFMGQPFRIWKSQTNWFYVQSSDRYLGWTEGGAFVAATADEVQAWNNAPLLMVTAADDRILERPDAQALPISDVVQGGLVRLVGREGRWYKVALPDGRTGYLPDVAATDYAAWKASRQPTPENIERTAKSFLGRPYFWGCNSVRGMDCSGFTKLVFLLNGVALDRNASQQCRQGTEIPLDDDLARLKKGDLLFFGRHGRGQAPEKVVHVGIYLGDKLFIQASSRVRISSLDPDSPLADTKRIRTLLHARRILGD